MSQSKKSEFRHVSVYSWGANSYGQLSINNKDDQLLPVKADIKCLTDGASIVKITGGGGHTVIIDENGKVYTCGWNEKGQLGLGHCMMVLVFTPLHFNFKVKKIACGWDFTLLVTDDGELYSCGSNSFGQLGIGKLGQFEMKYNKVEGFCGKVEQAAAGLRHSLAVTDNGTVYSWGNGNKGQLGRGSYLPKAETVPRKVTTSLVFHAIGAGSHHSVALGADNKVYCWGANQHCQCGTKNQNEEDLPKMINKPTLVILPEKIQSFSCGWSHVIAKGENSNIYGWGRTDYGQLACTPKDGRTYQHPMKLLGIPCTSEEIQSGAEHNIALDHSLLYTWGWNEHGMCATGDEHNVFQVHTVDTFAAQKVIHVGCGAGTSLVVIQQG